jgi:Cu(I)/Ag(I) efflux system protein CusF
MPFHPFRQSLLAVFLATSFAGVPALAQHAHEHGSPAPEAVKEAGKDKAALLATGTGVVKKVDRQNQRLVLAHEAIPALNWPSMTMAFSVANEDLLNRVKPGDKVNFELRDETTLGAIRVVGGEK